jgi:hypothetical protein
VLGSLWYIFVGPNGGRVYYRIINVLETFKTVHCYMEYYTPTHRVGAILQSPCPSVRSHFRNRYLSFYWKKWFYIWYMALAWWLVLCLPFPGLPHIYFLFTVRLTNERVGVFLAVLAVDDRHVAFCEYSGSVARIICVAVATLANEKRLERASDNDLLLCRKSTSNKTCYRQWFDRCRISKMIISGSFFSWNNIIRVPFRK